MAPNIENMPRKKIEKQEEVIKKIRKLDTTFSRPEKNENDSNALGHPSSPRNNVAPVDPSTINVCTSSGARNIPESESTEPSTSVIPIQQQRKLNMSSDPAEWTINNYTRDEIAMNGVKQNLDADFSKSKRVYSEHTRYLTLSLFERRLLMERKISALG